MSTPPPSARELFLDVAIACDVAAELSPREWDPEWDPACRPTVVVLRPYLAEMWSLVEECVAHAREVLEVRIRRHEGQFLINLYTDKEDAMPADEVNLGEVVMAFVRKEGNPSMKDICRMLQDEHAFGPAFGAAVVAGLRDRGRLIIDEAAGTVALAPGEEEDDDAQ